MPRVETEIHTKLPPDGVVAALTDFSERRPDIWTQLNRDVFEVYETGPTWAEVREGNNKRIWARERYDWSTPGTVKWTVLESPFSSTGDSVTAVITPSDGGSVIHLTWHRRGKTAGSKAFLGVLGLIIGGILKRYFRKTLDGLADRRGTETAP